MILRWLLIAPLTVALVMACILPAQKHIDAAKGEAFDDELLYLPNEKLLNHFTAGLDTIVADVLWLKCINYTSKHFREDHKFTWLGHMCDTITRLDPHFVDVYRYGGIFLAALKADDDASIQLMGKGVVNNPTSWELPYEMAMVYLLNRRDEPVAVELAATYLNLAVATGRAPESVVNFAANLQLRHNMVEVEREMWGELLKSEDEFMHDLAERKLIELGLRENCATLTKAVQVYAERFGALPESVEALVGKGIVGEIPADPTHGRYFIDADGAVQNTTVLDQKRDTWLNRLATARDKFKAAEGRLPASLEEIRDMGYLPFVPKHPYKGQAWNYNPGSGDIS